MAQQQIPIQSPIKGVVRAVNREGQPPDTAWDAISVLPYDRYGRRRLSQRAGLTKQFPNQMAATFVQSMIEAPNIVYPPNALTLPQLSFDDIGIVWPITTPGNFGPYTVPPQVNWGVDYTWNLAANISGAMSVTWTDGPGGGGLCSAAGNIILTVDVGAAPNYYFIELLGGVNWRNQGSGTAAASSVGVLVRSGTSFAGGTNIGGATVNGTPPADDATSGNFSGACTVVITLGGITINGTLYGTVLGATQFPQITSVSGTLGNNITSGDGTISSTSFTVAD